jgi:hypothetical protein
MVAMFSTACGLYSRSVPKELDWDLSRGHTTRDVKWPTDTTAFALEGGVRVKLRLPENKVLEDQVRTVMSRREEEVIRSLDLSYAATTTDEAYQLAMRLGREWEIDMHNIEAWYQRRLGQRRQGTEDPSDTAFTGTSHSRPLGGPGGPAPYIEVHNSFNKDRPVRVNLGFIWTRQ